MILSLGGSGYTWQAIDAMEYYDYQLLIICLNAYAAYQKLQSGKQQGSGTTLADPMALAGDL